MREDFYMRISERYKLDKDCVILQGSGGPIYTLGNVLVPTKLCGTTYNLIYTVVKEEHPPSRLLIGNPLLDVTQVTLSRDGPVIEPLVAIRST